MNITNRKLVTSAVLFLFLLSLSFAPAQAQTTAAEIGNNTVSGLIARADGKLYKYKTIVELRSAIDNKLAAIQIVANGKIFFTNVENNTYKIDIYYEKDLLNPGIDPAPLYSTSITMNTAAVTLPGITVVLPIKCPKGQSFYYQNGSPICQAMELRRPDFDTGEMEDTIFALANYYRQKSKLAPFKRNIVLYNSLKSHADNMAANNYFNLTNLSGCDPICRFNTSNQLASMPTAAIVYYYTYNRIYKDGTPAKYNTPYYIAYKIARKISYSKTRNHDFLESPLVINNEKVYGHFGTMADFTESERNEIQSLASSLTAEISDEESKINKIYTWIIENVSYDTKKKFFSYSGVSAFRNRVAVCSGYAELFRYMARFAGIDAEVVSGWVPQRHEWNKVTLDGQSLYLDPTWDAGYVYKRVFYSDPSYNYFLIPETCIKVDHYTDKKNKVSNRTAYIEANKSVFISQCSELYKKYMPTY